MRSGVSFPSYGAAAAYSAVTRTNLMVRSEPTLAQLSVSGGTVANTSAPADAPISAANWLHVGATSTVSFAYETPALAVSTAYCVSAFVEMDDLSAPKLTSSSVSGDMVLVLAGAVATSPVVTKLAGNVYRISALSTTPGSISLFNTGVLQYNTQSGKPFKVSLFQVEKGLFPTAIIKTAGASASDSSALNATYPLTNLPDLYNIRTPAVWAAAGGEYLSFVLTAQQAIQFLALAHHNAPAGATFRLILFSDTTPDPILNQAHVVHDSGVQSFVTPTPPYPQVQPYRLAAAVSARSGWIELSDRRLIDNVAWILGGIEIGGYWQWTDVEIPREIGFLNADVVAQQPFGVDHAMSQFAPRTFAGTRGTSDQSENATTAVDFHLEKKTARPFVYCWDVDDPTTYQRQCLLVRNSKLTPPNQGDAPTGTQTFNFIEHLR